MKTMVNEYFGVCVEIDATAVKEIERYAGIFSGICLDSYHINPDAIRPIENRLKEMGYEPIRTVQYGTPHCYEIIGKTVSGQDPASLQTELATLEDSFNEFVKEMGLKVEIREREFSV